MLLTFLSHLPATVLEIIAVTLLVVASGIIIIIFFVLTSEEACRRIVRLLHAIAGLTNKESTQQAKHKRSSDNK